MNFKKGLLIVIDGPSVSGKDSLIYALAQKIQDMGLYPYVFSEEFTDSKRQEILQARERGKMGGGSGEREMAAVLVAHRIELYSQFVRPNLEGGHPTIANRGEPATLAYQTLYGDLTMNEVWEMHRKGGVPIPDLVILTTLSPKEAMDREVRDKQNAAIRREREGGRGLSGKVAYNGVETEAEKLKRRELIHRQYDLVGKFLKRKGIPVITIDTEKKTVEEEVEEVLRRLKVEPEKKLEVPRHLKLR